MFMMFLKRYFFPKLPKTVISNLKKEKAQGKTPRFSNNKKIKIMKTKIIQRNRRPPQLSPSSFFR